MRHAFTVDVEDWYQGIPVDFGISAERRLDRGLNLLLDQMGDAGVRGTFFMLGPVARDHPDLVRRLEGEGHELGCHGWSHELIYEMSPRQMREETRRAIGVIGDLTGRQVTAYRAAYFSITRESWWALEILADMGIRLDSSVFPVRNWRYGIPDYPDGPQRVDTPSGSLWEIPMSVRRLAGRSIPVSGGAYFRIYPYRVTRANIRACERAGRPVVFYLHPWELDPGHPRVAFAWRPRVTHYFNLRSTGTKLRRLLGDFEFGTLSDLLARWIEGAEPVCPGV